MIGSQSKAAVWHRKSSQSKAAPERSRFMPSQLFFLTRELCDRVFDTLRESFEAILKQDNKEALAFAVLNPTLTYE